MFAKTLREGGAMPENNQHLADAVRRWIDSRGLTQSVIAARGGPSTSTLTKVLKGTGTLRPSIFADLDRGLEWGDGRAESEWRGVTAAPEGFDWRSVSDEQLLDEIATRMRRGGSDAGTAGPPKKSGGGGEPRSLSDYKRRRLDDAAQLQQDAADHPDDDPR